MYPKDYCNLSEHKNVADVFKVVKKNKEEKKKN